MTYFATVHFPFAEFNVCASWSGDDNDVHLFQLTQATLIPTLPSGMSVDIAAALVGQVSSIQAIHHFRFALQFATSVPTGLPESGESLDAQSFDIGGSRVMIGTEDGAAIASRLQWFPLSDANYPVRYLNNGFELAFECIPPNTILDFHFIIAYNARASENSSEWFAVDVRHTSVLQLDGRLVSSRSE